MTNINRNKEFLVDFLRPETPVEHSFFESQEFIKGLNWGYPRFGHPEGHVYKHVREVLDKVEILNLPEEERRILRNVTFTHDTFKHVEDRSLPRDWSKHHSVYAERFLSNYSDDEKALKITLHHDDIYHCWRRMVRHGQDVNDCRMINKVLEATEDFFQLYYLFFKCDTMTGDKLQEPLTWFEDFFSDKIEIINL